MLDLWPMFIIFSLKLGTQGITTVASGLVVSRFFSFCLRFRLMFLISEMGYLFFLKFFQH
jgi:hypothetical protein